MNRNVKNILIFLTNGFILTIVIFFQTLLFAQLPAISPDVIPSRKKSEAISAALSESTVLLSEITISIIICFILNKYIFKISYKNAIWISLVELLILAISAVTVSFGYINKFG